MNRHWSQSLLFRLRNSRKCLCKEKKIFGSLQLIIDGSRSRSACVSCCAYWGSLQGYGPLWWLLALVTCERAQVTRHRLHMTCDTGHMRTFFFLFFSRICLLSEQVERFSVSRVRNFIVTKTHTNV